MSSVVLIGGRGLNLVIQLTVVCRGWGSSRPVRGFGLPFLRNHVSDVGGGDERVPELRPLVPFWDVGWPGTWPR